MKVRGEAPKSSLKKCRDATPSDVAQSTGHEASNRKEVEKSILMTPLMTVGLHCSGARGPPSSGDFQSVMRERVGQLRSHAGAVHR